MNHTMIAGHLGADPEIRFTSSGKKVTTLRVATRSRKGQNEETIWWRATIWGEQFDKMVGYLKKGSAVILFGEMHKPELFNDREGKPQISLEITVSQLQFSPFGKSNPSSPSPVASATVQNTTGPIPPFGIHHPGIETETQASSYATSPSGETFDDEVPF